MASDADMDAIAMELPILTGLLLDIAECEKELASGGPSSAMLEQIAASQVRTLLGHYHHRRRRRRARLPFHPSHQHSIAPRQHRDAAGYRRNYPRSAAAANTMAATATDAAAAANTAYCCCRDRPYRSPNHAINASA